MRILNSSKNILDLDLSFNNVSFENLNNLESIQRLKLEKVSLPHMAYFAEFLSDTLIELDDSQINFKFWQQEIALNLKLILCVSML